MSIYTYSPRDWIVFPRRAKGGNEMNKKQRATLAAIFEVPTRPDVRWPDLEGLVKALNGIVAER